MLHMESPHHHRIYAPLSQVMTESDDDSEEEIHNTSKLRQQQHQQLQHQQQQQQSNYKNSNNNNNINSNTTSNNRRHRAPPTFLPLNQRRQQQHHPQQQQQQQQTQQQAVYQSQPPPPRTPQYQFERLEEDHEHHHYRYQQQQKQQRLQREQNQRHYKAAIGNGHNNTSQPTSYTTNMQNTFRSVMMSDIGLNGDGVGPAGGGGGIAGGVTGGGSHCDPSGSNFSSFNSDYDDHNNTDADNVAILGHPDEGKFGSSTMSSSPHELMSPTRRCCFIASLLLCAFAVFAFLWLVPCGGDEACPARPDRIKSHNWLLNYTKIELKGGVHIVSGVRSWENNLIFLYRGDAFFPGKAQRNGIISLVGSSGAVAWYDEMIDEPVAIDCTLLDVDRNGRPDCVVVDECGQLGAINPVSGQWHWRYKERSAYRVDAWDFPVILPDVDGDGVLDLLAVSSVSLEQRTKAFVQKGGAAALADMRRQRAERNVLLILSGRSGQTIGEGYRLHECDVVRKLQLEGTQTVTFSCVRNKTEAQRSKTLAELYALITNKSLAGRRLLPPASEITQHYRHYGGARRGAGGAGGGGGGGVSGGGGETQRNTYSLSGRELVVENRGQCPHNCNMTFVLSETRGGQIKVLRNITSAGMYGMVPAQWHFKNTKTKLSGFVMKFWKWNGVGQGLSEGPPPQGGSTAHENGGAGGGRSNKNNYVGGANEAANTAKAAKSAHNALKKAKAFKESANAAAAAAAANNNNHKENSVKSASASLAHKMNETRANRPIQLDAHQRLKRGAEEEESINQEQKPLNSPHAEEFNVFDQLRTQRHTFTLPELPPSLAKVELPEERRLRRSVDAAHSVGAHANASHTAPHLLKGQQQMLLANYKMQMITETVILVLFNGADTRIENTSQSNIVQFCRRRHQQQSQQQQHPHLHPLGGGGGGGEADEESAAEEEARLICQPELGNQENSMLIADLDQDDSQELVTYTSTFVPTNEAQTDWRLVTYVRLVRLQAELPQIYADDNVGGTGSGSSANKSGSKK